VFYRGSYVLALDRTVQSPTVTKSLCVKHRISGFGQRVRPAEALGRQGTASWPVRGRSVFNTPYLSFEAASRLAPDNERLVQDRAGEPRGRRQSPQTEAATSVDMLKLVLVRPCRPSLEPAHALRGGGDKRKERLSVRANRFGLGQLIRAQVRPMAGDSPSGYSLAGQSGKAH